MPYVHVETSASVASAKDTLFRVSAFVADLLKKDEQWVMCGLDADRAMLFGGSNALCAFVRVEGIGIAPEGCNAFAKALCGFLEEELSVEKDRIYVLFTDIDARRMGWNGKTFA